jgi:hypothetical protein
MSEGQIANHLSPPDNAADARELVLPLTDIAHLFNAPRIEPLSRSPPEVLGVSGVDYLLSLLHLDKKWQRARRLSILLPPGKATPALAEQMTTALHRMVRLRIEQQRRQLRDTYRYGWKAAAIAVVILAICLSLSSVFTSDQGEGTRPLLRKTFEYGFEIVGWVILWHPIEVLVFEPLAIRSRIAALKTLATVEVFIRPEEGMPQPQLPEKGEPYGYPNPGPDLVAPL